MQAYCIVTTRNDGFVASLYGYYVERNVSATQLIQRHVENLGSLAHLGTKQYQCTSGKLPPLSNPAHLYGIYYIFCRKHLRINKRVYSQLGEELLILR